MRHCGAGEPRLGDQTVLGLDPLSATYWLYNLVRFTVYLTRALHNNLLSIEMNCRLTRE